jgi:hypothetical protein
MVDQDHKAFTTQHKGITWREPERVRESKRERERERERERVGEGEGEGESTRVERERGRRERRAFSQLVRVFSKSKQQLQQQTEE